MRPVPLAGQFPCSLSQLIIIHETTFDFAPQLGQFKGTIDKEFARHSLTPSSRGETNHFLVLFRLLPSDLSDRPEVIYGSESAPGEGRLRIFVAEEE